MQKLTKKMFSETHPYFAKMRRIDPIQFDVCYNEWIRDNEKKVYPQPNLRTFDINDRIRESEKNPNSKKNWVK
jgi:uncharacterized protein YeeX (DUF496 family)